MKYPLLLTSLLFLSLLAAAQTQKDTVAAKIKDTPASKISLSKLPKSNIKLYYRAPADSPFYQFSHFEVIDERPDTARIGLRTNKSGSMFSGRDRQLVFDQPTATEIAGYLNQHFTLRSAPCTALVILRSLWLSDAIYISRDDMHDDDKEFGKSHIRLKAEVYACKDSLYTPVFRYDTFYIEKTTDYEASLKFSYSELEKDLADLVINLADSASLVAQDKQGKGRQITRQQINDFNQTRFTSPFDNTTSYSRGVYMSFEEFRNNAPSIRDFEVRRENKDQQVLYISDASGAPYYCRTAWGYCDGKSIFIMRDGVLCPAWKEGSAFYFYAFSTTTKKNTFNSTNPGVGNMLMGGTSALMPTPVSPMVAIPAYSRIKERTIYTIDMDTGNAY
jgi:hypothetical protein